MSLGAVSLIVMYTAQLQTRMCDQVFLLVALMENLLDSEDGNLPDRREMRKKKQTNGVLVVVSCGNCSELAIS